MNKNYVKIAVVSVIAIALILVGTKVFAKGNKTNNQNLPPDVKPTGETINTPEGEKQVVIQKDSFGTEQKGTIDKDGNFIPMLTKQRR